MSQTEIQLFVETPISKKESSQPNTQPSSKDATPITSPKLEESKRKSLRKSGNFSSSQEHYIPPELFDTMITNQGVSISDLNRSGLKVVLFFMRHFACAYCLANIDEIYNLHDSLLKNSCIPVLVHMETEESIAEYYSTTERKKEFLSMHRMRQTDEIMKYFGINQQSILAGVASALKFTFISKMRGFMVDEGFVNDQKEFLTNQPKTDSGKFDVEKSVRLSSVFVIGDCKVIFHVAASNADDRIDIARIVVEYATQDMLNDLVESKYSKKLNNKPRPMLPAFEGKTLRLNCITPEVRPETDLELAQFLTTPSDFLLLKIWMTKEYNCENLIFYSHVMHYRQISDKNLRIKSAKLMYDTFFNKESVLQLNVTKRENEEIHSHLSDPKVDLFNEVLQTNIMNSIAESFARFKLSDLYAERLSNRRTSRKSIVLQWV